MNKWFITPLRYWFPISIALVILLLCLLPASEITRIPVEIGFGDLVVHFFMFLVFSAVLFNDLDKSWPGNRITSLISTIISMLFALSTELLQYLLVFLNRSGSLLDLLFDFIGTIGGIALVLVIKRRSVPGP